MREHETLHTIALSRLRWDQRTRDYVERRTTAGKTHREAIRCLKRYIAREIYKLITHPHAPKSQRRLDIHWGISPLA